METQCCIASAVCLPLSGTSDFSTLQRFRMEVRADGSAGWLFADTRIMLHTADVEALARDKVASAVWTLKRRGDFFAIDDDESMRMPFMLRIGIVRDIIDRSREPNVRHQRLGGLSGSTMSSGTRIVASPRNSGNGKPG